MDAELKQKWTAALRSGEYRQGQSALKDADAYCCLGVLASVKGCTWRAGDDYGEIPILDGKKAGLSSDEMSYLNEEIFGLSWEEDQRQLADMNDSSKPFPEIADWIEQNISSLPQDE